MNDNSQEKSTDDNSVMNLRYYLISQYKFIFWKKTFGTSSSLVATYKTHIGYCQVQLKIQNTNYIVYISFFHFGECACG